MKLKRLFLGASLVFLLSSCTIRLPWQKSDSNASSQTSQQGSGSGTSSGGQSSGGTTSSTELPPDVNTYYASISDSLTGTELRTALNTLNNQKTQII